MTAELRCESIAKWFGSHPVLSGVDLSVPPGTVTSVLGASGSGKTTLLRVIAGLEAPDSGRVLVGDRCVEDAGEAAELANPAGKADGARRITAVHVPPERRGIGYVAQEGALFPHLSVGENVGFGLERPSRRGGPRIDEVLALVGLGSRFANRRPQELSGGEQRRVALARALAPAPSLIVLDEPFSGLDAGLRAETRSAVSAALEATGTTGLLVTHDQAEAMSMGREVAVLRDGRLVQTAPPEVVYRRPIDLDVARFVGEAVVVDGVASGGRVECVLGSLAVISGYELSGRVSVVIRPEQIAIVDLGSVGAMAARVTAREFYGPNQSVTLTLDGNAVAVTSRLPGHLECAVGTEVAVAVAGDVPVFSADFATES